MASGVANGTTVAVTAVAKPHYVLTGESSFSHTFPIPECEPALIEVAPVAPMFYDAV